MHLPKTGQRPHILFQTGHHVFLLQDTSPLKLASQQWLCAVINWPLYALLIKKNALMNLRAATPDDEAIIVSLIPFPPSMKGAW